MQTATIIIDPTADGLLLAGNTYPNTVCLPEAVFITGIIADWGNDDHDEVTAIIYTDGTPVPVDQWEALAVAVGGWQNIFAALFPLRGQRQATA